MIQHTEEMNSEETEKEFRIFERWDGELNSDIELFTHCREKLYNLSNY